MSDQPGPFLHVAINTPVADGFDYLPAKDAELPPPGALLRVPFGSREVIAVLLEIRGHSDVPAAKLKPVLQTIDAKIVLNDDLLQLAHWISRYYQQPLGEVIFTMLPAALRRAGRSHSRVVRRWRWTLRDVELPPDLTRAPKQKQIHDMLRLANDGLDSDFFQQHVPGWQAAMRALLDKNLVERHAEIPTTAETGNPAAAAAGMPELNTDQRQAVDAVLSHLDSFTVCLLQGVTGSGKTEVYLRVIAHLLLQQRQVLVLVPEIGLTPQLHERFKSRLPGEIFLLHSGLNDGERLNIWQAAANGSASVIIGTRSAVFLPLQRPGLIIVDEEHDNSFKQQDGVRYHARDIAVLRAQRFGIPVVLGSATPSLETLYNVETGRYRLLQLPVRAGAASLPRMVLIDARKTPFDQLLSRPALDAMHRHLEQGSQVLIFLNRRGYAPTLLCHQCGWVAHCTRCDAHMTLHKMAARLRCHHCGHEQAVAVRCPDCGQDGLDTLGVGTEQIEQFVRAQFPSRIIARIDRDAVRRKGELQSALSKAQSGHTDILIGTQMLSKGHDFPQVTLVIVLGIDRGLFSADFRGPEYMAQLIVQVAGRAGRAEAPGEVFIETHQPEHVLLQLLLKQNYSSFAQTALAERRAAALPPYSRFALIRAESVAAGDALEFLQQLRQQVHGNLPGEVQPLGPLPAPMERRAGRYRAQLLLQSADRPALLRVVTTLRELAQKTPMGRKVRWSIDVDPTEML